MRGTARRGTLRSEVKEEEAAGRRGTRAEKSPPPSRALQTKTPPNEKPPEGGSLTTNATHHTRIYHSRNFTRNRAIDWLCNWHTRLSVTFNTAAISLRFMSCS